MLNGMLDGLYKSSGSFALGRHPSGALILTIPAAAPPVRSM
jgi:hypothetical protein